MQLIKFYADWCGPCKLMKPVVDKLAKAQEIPLTEVNIDTEPELSEHYQVSSIPTVILTREDGREIRRFTGANTYAKISQELFPDLTNPT